MINMYCNEIIYYKINGEWELVGESSEMATYIVDCCFKYPYEITYNNKKMTKKQVVNGYLYRAVNDSERVVIRKYLDRQTKEVVEVDVEIY